MEKRKCRKEEERIEPLWKETVERCKKKKKKNVC